jgi:hypothetical protein
VYLHHSDVHRTYGVEQDNSGRKKRPPAAKQRLDIFLERLKCENVSHGWRSNDFWSLDKEIRFRVRRENFNIKGKAVTLHATEALVGERRYIAPTHSRPRNYMGVSGQHHAPAALYSQGKDPPGTHCTGGWVGPRAGLDTEVRGKILCTCRGSNPDRPVFQPVVRYYTAWANPAHR